MIAAWIVYALAVGGLVGAGALALEKLQRTHGLSARWTWAGAILLSFGWPLGHWVLENRPDAVPLASASDVPVVALADIPVKALTLEPVAVEVSAQSVLRLMDGPILAAWILASGVLLLFFAFLFIRTDRLRAGWLRGTAGGENVLFSDEWGPAVVGFIRPQVVLPEWCRDMDDWALRFILDHELEHVRAGDLRLIIMAGVLPVLFPWHLPLWWQLTRLRTAVEGDCDLRVMGRNPGQVRPYVDLLLDVGERASRGRPLAAMLSEPYETLKRRIGIMTMPLPKKPWVRGGLLALAGTVSVALACWAPGPTDAEDREGVEGANPVTQAVVGSDQEGTVLPTFTPYIVNPSVTNRDQVEEVLSREYQPLLEGANIGGEVSVWFFLDEEGRPIRTMVNGSSGHKALDDAALQIASLVEYSPALNRDRRMPVWVSQPIIFTTDESFEVNEPEAGSTRATRPAPAEDVPIIPGQTGVIVGTAIDDATDQPLANAQLLVAGTGRGTLSNADGRFRLTDVPAGDRALFAVLVGFGQVRQEVAVETEGTVEVEVRLEPTAILLDPLVVRGGE